jgi:WD40 repeat protein
MGRIKEGQCVGVVLLVGALAAVWLNCSERPTSPVPAELVDYSCYCADLYDPVAYRYRVLSGALDTIDLPFLAERGMTVSPDGSTLYVAGHDAVAAVDVATEEFTTVWNGFAGHGVTVSPNGKYLAVQGQDLRILDIESLSIVHSDTDETFLGVFSADSRRFYAPGGAVAQIYKVSLDGSGMVSRSSFPNRLYTRLRLSEDETKWFLWDAEECAGHFEVLDLLADSIVFSRRYAPGNARLALSRDGRWAFFTNPGLILDICDLSPNPLYTIEVYNVADNATATPISTKVTTDAGLPDSALIVDVVVTPDNRWLVGMSWRGEFVTIDLDQMKVVRFLRIATPRRPTEFLSCQGQP